MWRQWVHSTKTAKTTNRIIIRVLFTVRFPCINDQKDWLNRKNAGTLGHMELKPQCDRNGNYMPVKCIPGQT